MEHNKTKIKDNTHGMHYQKGNRHRVSINKGCELKLTDIQELSNEHLSSAKSNLDFYDKVDRQTMDLIITYRNLDLPCLKSMTEEETVARYLDDPFFRKKLEYQFEYLSKLKSKTKFALFEKQNDNESPKSQGSPKSKNVRFKDIVLDEVRHKIKEGKKYENLLKKVSSQQLCRMPLNL